MTKISFNAVIIFRVPATISLEFGLPTLGLKVFGSLSMAKHYYFGTQVTFVFEKQVLNF